MTCWPKAVGCMVCRPGARSSSRWPSSRSSRPIWVPAGACGTRNPRRDRPAPAGRGPARRRLDSRPRPRPPGPAGVPVRRPPHHPHLPAPDPAWTPRGRRLATGRPTCRSPPAPPTPGTTTPSPQHHYRQHHLPRTTGPDRATTPGPMASSSYDTRHVGTNQAERSGSDPLPGGSSRLIAGQWHIRWIFRQDYGDPGQGGE